MSTASRKRNVKIPTPNSAGRRPVEAVKREPLNVTELYKQLHKSSTSSPTIKVRGAFGCNKIDRKRKQDIIDREIEAKAAAAKPVEVVTNANE